MTSLLFLVLQIGPSHSSHIMQSESAESEFEMIDNVDEVVVEEEKPEIKGDELPGQGPIHVPHLLHPGKKHETPTPRLDEVRF